MLNDYPNILTVHGERCGLAEFKLDLRNIKPMLNL